MAVLSLLISIIALVIAYLAYARGGGAIKEIKRRVEDLGAAAETLRNRTADILENLEKKVRGEQSTSEVQPDKKGPEQQDPSV